MRPLDSLFLCSQIFHYDHPIANILHEDFSERLNWRGTPSHDIQTASIYISNVTFRDAGTYRCTFHRTLFLPLYDPNVTVEKEVELAVVAVGKSGHGCSVYFSVKSLKHEPATTV